MISNLKRVFAKRLYKFVRHWAVDVESGLATRIEAYRARGMRIGRNVAIYNSNLDDLYPELITIGDDVTITHAVVLTHDDAPVLFLRRRRIAPVRIGSRVFVGHHSMIMPGVTIGDDCVIGAGSIVTRDVPAGSIVAGNPAKLIRSTASYVDRLGSDEKMLTTTLASNITTVREESLMTREVRERYRPDLPAPRDDD